MAEPSAPSDQRVSGSTSVLDAADTAAAPQRHRAVYGALVIATAAVVVAAALGVIAWNAQNRQSESIAAVDAARQVATNLTSIRSDSAEADLQRLLDVSSGDFRAQFEQRRGAFVSIVQQAKVTTDGRAVEAALDARDGDTARVLVAVRSEVQNSATSRPEQRDYRLLMTMKLDGGRWLADKVEFVA
jgi:Mce-associated membrane protein